MSAPNAVPSSTEYALTLRQRLASAYETARRHSGNFGREEEEKIKQASIQQTFSSWWQHLATLYSKKGRQKFSRPLSLPYLMVSVLSYVTYSKQRVRAAKPKEIHTDCSSCTGRSAWRRSPKDVCQWEALPRASVKELGLEGRGHSNACCISPWCYWILSQLYYKLRDFMHAYPFLGVASVVASNCNASYSHVEFRHKYSAAHRFFNSLLSVSSGDETLRLMLDILHKN